MRTRNICLGIAGGLAGLTPVSLVSAGGGNAEITHLYREDAGAEFVVPEGDCGPARSQVGVGAHQDVFWSNTTPPTRSVQLGVSIQLFDCDGQFVIGASGEESARRFKITGFLARARIDATIEACRYFPGPGDCFPVDVHLEFREVGSADMDRHHTNIREPDCRIIERDRSAVRIAKVSGTISYTLPGQESRTLHVDTTDLSPAGASLSSASEFQYVKGSSGLCIEQTG